MGVKSGGTMAEKLESLEVFERKEKEISSRIKDAVLEADRKKAVKDTQAEKKERAMLALGWYKYNGKWYSRD